jgi:hypothetical protein
MKPHATIAMLGLTGLLLAACGGTAEEDEGTGSNPAPASSDGGSGSEAPAGNSGNNSIALELALESVIPRTVNLEDDEDEFVEFCFAANVQTVGEATLFSLQGPDVGTVNQAQSAELVEDRTECVLAGFEQDTDVSSKTIGVVETGAVEDASAEVNLQQSEPLGGASGGDGLTDGPDLIGAEPDQTLDRIRYEFDEELEEGEGPAADQFGYYTESGVRQTGESITSIEASVVTVQFGEGGSTRVDNAENFFVEQAAVQDKAGAENPRAAAGGTTSKPGLTAIRRDAATMQFDFVFSVPVQAGDVSRFTVYTPDGQDYTGASFTQPEPNTVRVAFPDTQEFADQLVLGTTGEGAVSSTDQSRNESTIGSVAIPGTAGGTAGATTGTTGPDLVSATVNGDTGQVSLVFDEPLKDDGQFEPSAFKAVTNDGETFLGQSFVSVTGETVTITFDSNAITEIGAVAVDRDAVENERGTRNPTDSVRIP